MKKSLSSAKFIDLNYFHNGEMKTFSIFVVNFLSSSLVINLRILYRNIYTNAMKFCFSIINEIYSLWMEYFDITLKIKVRKFATRLCNDFNPICVVIYLRIARPKKKSYKYIQFSTFTITFSSSILFRSYYFLLFWSLIIFFSSSSYTIVFFCSKVLL